MRAGKVAAAVVVLFAGVARAEGIIGSEQVRCQIVWEDTDTQEAQRYRVRFSDTRVVGLEYRDAANLNWVPVEHLRSSNREINFQRGSRFYNISRPTGELWADGRPENGSGSCGPVEYLRGYGDPGW